jgi:hypothetical protein
VNDRSHGLTMRINHVVVLASLWPRLPLVMRLVRRNALKQLWDLSLETEAQCTL